MSLNTRNHVKGDQRPSDYEYACLSKHVYTVQDTTLEVGTQFSTAFHQWTICFVSATSYCGYFGAVYACEETKQYVIVHRGTNNFLDIVEDYVGVLRNKCSRQKSEAFRVVDLIVQKIRVSGNGYHLSFTGHSLGAFLAELSVYFSTVVLEYPDVNAVTFESPGSLQSMKYMKATCWHPSDLRSSNEENPNKNGSDGDDDSKESSLSFSATSWLSSPSWHSLQIIPHSASCNSLRSLPPSSDFDFIIKQLDIISYVCYPNIINTCNEHVGTLYAINICMEEHKTSWPHRLLSSHSIVGIVEWFQKCITGDQRCVRLYMADWPTKYVESEVFFKYAKFQDGMLSVENLLDEANPYHYSRPSFKRRKSLVVESTIQFEKWIKKQRNKFILKFHGNFNAVHGSTNTLPMHHLALPLQHFLSYFHQKRKYIIQKHSTQEEELRKFWKQTWKGFNMPGNVLDELLLFNLETNKLRILEIVCSKCAVHDFRTLLSMWLEKTGFTVDEIIDEDLVYENMWRLSISKSGKEGVWK